MVAYTKPQHRKKKESEREKLRGERDKIKFINWSMYSLQVYGPHILQLSPL